MADALAVVTLKNLSGIPKDDFQNAFVVHMDAEVGDFEETDFDDVQTALVAFYNANQLNGASIAAYTANTVSRAAGACLIRYYDITGKLQGVANAKGNIVPPPHGSPLTVGAFTLGAAGGATSLPSEVSVVMTLRGRDALERPVETSDGSDAGTLIDRPRQRSTGRLYLGPLTTAALAAQGADNQVRPQVAMMTTMRQAAEKLQDDLNALGFIWCVWSRTEGELKGIVQVETDDAFDTQRRRGAQPAARTATAFIPVPDLALGA